MWSYYGSKSKVVHKYPAPKFNKIIEPFAGSARYALRWWERDILLVDKYKVIVDIWHYLQQASEKDILSLPSPQRGETINRDDYDCIDQANLMGFIVQQGVNAPRLTVSSVGNFGACIDRDKKRIAQNLHKIRHWEIRHGDYTEIENETATWFIDPPYQYGGEYYRINNSTIDFAQLSEWCKSRNGQAIVCENMKADWLPFVPLSKMRGSKHTTTEAIWSNYHVPYQIEMFGD